MDEQVYVAKYQSNDHSDIFELMFLQTISPVVGDKENQHYNSIDDDPLMPFDGNAFYGRNLRII